MGGRAVERHAGRGSVAAGLIRPVALVAALASSGSVAAGGGAGTCARDLFMAEASLRQTADRLERAGEGQAERCGAWRLHVNTLRAVAGTYDRCLDARGRAEKAGPLKTMAGEFDGLIRQRCR